jgi:mRNA interferase RelE/StbE
MAYKIVPSKAYIKDLSKLDKTIAIQIIEWVNDNLLDIKNPRKIGKRLSGPLKKYWRYRVGDYRIIAKIYDGKIELCLINVGHRKDIYLKL